MALARDNQHGPLEQRVPPQNTDLEMSVLGAIMLEPQHAYPLAAEVLTRGSFYLDGHGILFDLMGEMLKRGLPPDAQSVIDELRARNLLARVGGPAVVTGMLNMVPTAANIEVHARKVQDKANLRALIRSCTRVVEEAYKQELAPDAIMEIAESTILTLARDLGTRRGVVPYAQHLQDYWKQITDRETVRDNLTAAGQDTSDWVPGIPTGLPSLDRSIKGFMPTDLITVIARTSTGKTAQMLNWAYHVAVKLRVPCGFITLEQSPESISNRLLALGTMHFNSGLLKYIDSRRIDQVGRPLSENEWETLTKSYQAQAGAPLWIDKPSIEWAGASGVKAAIASMVDQGAKVVFVDYIGKLRKLRGLEDWESQGEYAQLFKEVTDRYGITVVTGAQVNSEAFQGNRRSGWIGLHNIARARKIADESSIVIAIEPLALDEKGEIKKDKGGRPQPASDGGWPAPTVDEGAVPGFLNVLKNRGGPTGSIRVNWYAHAMAFVERTDEPDLYQHNARDYQ